MCVCVWRGGGLLVAMRRLGIKSALLAEIGRNVDEMHSRNVA